VKKGWEAISQRKFPKPEIKPKGSRSPVPYGGFRDRAKGGDASDDGLPNGGVNMMAVSKVVVGGPAVTMTEPTSPRGSRVGVNLGSEFREKILVLSIGVSTELTRRRRPPIGRERPRQPDNCKSHLDIMGLKCLFFMQTVFISS
jgi:hypothetical protein